MINRYGSARDAILRAGLRTFDSVGFDDATVASICASAGASNGSFFHFFGSKKGLAAELFLASLRSYHAAMLAVLESAPGAATGFTGSLGSATRAGILRVNVEPFPISLATVISPPII